MTPDDKRRLAEIDALLALYRRARVRGFANHGPGSDKIGYDDAVLIRRLLYEATAERDASALKWGEAMDRWEEALNKIATSTAERDAAMAALRDLVHQIEINDFRDSLGHAVFRLHAYTKAQGLLAAHSAATKPTEAQE